MGRKGGGRAGFMKASRKGPDSDDEEEVVPKAASVPKDARGAWGACSAASLHPLLTPG